MQWCNALRKAHSIFTLFSCKRPATLLSWSRKKRGGEGGRSTTNCKNDGNNGHSTSRTAPTFFIPGGDLVYYEAAVVVVVVLGNGETRTPSFRPWVHFTHARTHHFHCTPLITHTHMHTSQRIGSSWCMIPPPVLPFIFCFELLNLCATFLSLFFHYCCCFLLLLVGLFCIILS